MKMKSHSKEIKVLPIYLQPRILSAVSYVHVAPNKEVALERIEKLSKKLSDREMVYVMSLLVFDNILDTVKKSDEFKNFTQARKERTIH
tara:strand:- start:237 stop:503 length:267 start_codon:yes stop_codon:yes gene_type:complete